MICTCSTKAGCVRPGARWALTSKQRKGVHGVRFAVWAPNAERVSVVGDFNRWDGRVHPMGVHGSSGVWELFIPDLPEGELYKYEIRNRDYRRGDGQDRPVRARVRAPARHGRAGARGGMRTSGATKPG